MSDRNIINLNEKKIEKLAKEGKPIPCNSPFGPNGGPFIYFDDATGKYHDEDGLEVDQSGNRK